MTMFSVHNHLLSPLKRDLLLLLEGEPKKLMTVRNFDIECGNLGLLVI
jgi:hypothetical protein